MAGAQHSVRAQSRQAAQGTAGARVWPCTAGGAWLGLPYPGARTTHIWEPALCGAPCVRGDREVDGRISSPWYSSLIEYLQFLLPFTCLSSCLLPFVFL